MAGKDSIKEAISYCSQCFDILDIRDRNLENKKAEIIQLESILRNQIAEIESLKTSIELLKKVYSADTKALRKNNRRQFWKGVWMSLKMVAGVVVITVVLVII